MSRYREVQAARSAVIEHAVSVVAAERAGLFARVGWAEFRQAVENYIELTADLDGRGAANGQPTSILAAVTTLPNKRSVRYLIVATLVAHYQHFNTGMNITELKNRLRREHSTVSGAVNYLVSNGWVRDSGETRLTNYGKPAIVWVPTERAVNAMRDSIVGVA